MNRADQLKELRFINRRMENERLELEIKIKELDKQIREKEMKRKDWNFAFSIINTILFIALIIALFTK